MTGLAVAAVAVAVVLVLAAIALQVAEMRRRRRTTATVEQLQARIAELEAGLDTVAELPVRPTAGRSEPSRSRRETSEFVITTIGAEDDPAPVERVDLSPPAFADAVLRESVVHAASFAAGVRRALSPEVRHRIAFEMRRELKRSRKARKAEVKEALREYRARHRAEVDLDGAVLRAEEAS